jgi:predicted DNA-binding transcriptional regulator YafY
MSPAETAHERFLRIIDLIATIRGRGPQRLADLAEALQLTERQLNADVDELLGRVYYRAGGWVDDIPIYLEGDTIEIPETRAFDRPIRLSTAETLCLMLALRTAVARSYHDGAPGALEPLLEAAEAHLAAADWTPETLETVLAADFTPDPVGIRETLLRCIRERTPCTLTYLKSGGAEAEPRTIHPWALVYANGASYCIGWCTLRAGMRQFRVDRILDAAPDEGTFTVPEDFDPATELPSLQLRNGSEATPVRVRYARGAAPWVREDARRRGFEWTELADGQVEIVHRVGDVTWLLSHILEMAPQAEVLEPVEMRAWVREAAGRLTRSPEP